MIMVLSSFFLCGGQKKLLSQIVCWDRSETFSCGATRLGGNPPSHAHYHAPALVDGEPPPARLLPFQLALIGPFTGLPIATLPPSAALYRREIPVTSPNHRFLLLYGNACVASRVYPKINPSAFLAGKISGAPRPLQEPAHSSQDTNPSGSSYRTPSAGWRRNR